MASATDDKRCKRCKGLCPAGTLPNDLCLDCDRQDSPEEEAKRAFALALAARSPAWRRFVWAQSLL